MFKNCRLKSFCRKWLPGKVFNNSCLFFISRMFTLAIIVRSVDGLTSHHTYGIVIWQAIINTCDFSTIFSHIFSVH